MQDAAQAPEIPDDEGNALEYMSCPLTFIPRSVHQFIEQRDWIEKYPHTAPRFEDVSERWRAMDRYYAGKFAEYRKLTERKG